MKRIRKKFLLRSFAVFIVLVLFTNILYPTISYALTTGPHQPEFTSYEGPGATDMVNLLTGDFAYNMPLLTVPIGSEASFPVPLSYHAGFGPEAEASWVGLGWNVNVGSLTRTINGFPDDASGETQTVHVQDPGTHGWSATILGTTLGWDKQVGHYGVLNLGTKVGYKNGGITSVGMAGLTVSGSSAQFNAQEFVMTVVQVVMAIATYGASEAGSWAVQLAMELGTELMMDMAREGYSPDVGSEGYWKFSKDTDKTLFVTNYKVWLDRTRYEDMWGTLYLDKAETQTLTDVPKLLPVKHLINNTAETVKRFEVGTSTQNYLKGTASDINIDLNATTDYINNTSPVALAYDNFSVNAPGISGAIKPYRLEVGSVSTPREMSERHTRLSPISYMPYKVPFVYEGGGNRYFHHGGAPVGQNVTAPGFNFGLNGQLETSGGQQSMLYSFDDAIFGTQRIATENATSKRVTQGPYIDWLSNTEIESTAAGFLPRAFLDYFPPQDRIALRNTHDFRATSWVISTNTTFPDGAIYFSFQNAQDYFVPGEPVDIRVSVIAIEEDQGYQNAVPTGYISHSVNVLSVSGNSIVVDRSAFTQTEIDQMNVADRVSIAVNGRSAKPDNSIGGFVITGADGMNYHFALPVYDYEFKSEIINAADAGKKSAISRETPFANTWLLTAITGPDFVDRGGASNAANGVIDDSDWGYWIKFNYGRNNKDFEWRIPFDGYKMSPTSQHKSYVGGKKEQFYLNSIETRSHTALFIKDTRLDSRSKNDKTSLRLAEIALITKGTYDAMKTAGLPAAAGRIDVIYKTSDFSGTIGTLLQTNAIRRVVFNTDYTLCAGTTNSTAAGGGKLTLKSLSFLGKNNAKVFPDYTFEYGANPGFNANHWDGWGMYRAGGTSAGTTHTALSSGPDTWCLKKITSPEGAVVDVVYERDAYSSISGNDVVYRVGYSADGTVIPNPGHLYYIPQQAGSFAVGDTVHITGFVNYRCADGSWGPTTPIDVETTITSVTNGMTFQNPFIVLSSLGCPGGVENNTIDYMEIDVRKKIERPGGNLRVASIKLSEAGGQQFKTRYLYNQADGRSSGVVSQEPEYIRDVDYEFYDWLGYPMTPVFYKTVTVLSGKLSNDADYHTRQVFEFEVPDVSQYTPGKTVVKNKDLIKETVEQTGIFETRYRDYVTVYKNEISDRTSRVGKIKSAKTFDKQSITPYESQEFIYFESPTNAGVNNYQGVFTEGALLADMSSTMIFGGNVVDVSRYHKMQRTSIVRYPYVLQKIIVNRDGFESSDENTNWDLITGTVLERTATDPMGLKVQTVIEPAYTKYPSMASKVLDPANKNMLTQTAATYVYRLNSSGVQSGMLSASVSLWRQNWINYRILNSAGDTYSDGSDLNSGQTGVWRIADGYTWTGFIARVKPDGSRTFLSGDKYKFTQTTNSGWQKTSSVVRYNHYSYVLEAQDGVSGLYSAVKLGYKDNLLLGSATNAKYMEIAYSGAEDQVTTRFFGGEVALGTGTVVSNGHTGTKALSLSSGNGFVYKSDGLTAGSTYRAMVWTNSANGRLYYKLNGGSEVLSAAPSEQEKVGSWYRLQMEVPYGASMEVGVKSASPASGAILFDDFRFQPTDASMECYVYDPITNAITHVLGNDHLYKRYEYGDNGTLIKVYKETFLYGEKLVTEMKQNYKRSHE